MNIFLNLIMCKMLYAPRVKKQITPHPPLNKHCCYVSGFKLCSQAQSFTS